MDIMKPSLKKKSETIKFIDRMTNMSENEASSLNTILMSDPYFAEYREPFDIKLYKKIQKYCELSIDI